MIRYELIRVNMHSLGIVVDSVYPLCWVTCGEEIIAIVQRNTGIVPCA